MTTPPHAKSKLSSQQQELLKKRLAQRKNNIPRQSHSGTVPASLAQNRLWLENELVPDSPIYNIARRWQLNGRLDISALEKSFNTIIARHEALRTTFALQAEQVVQKIQPQLVLSLPVVDLTDLSESERAERVEVLAKEEAKRPFDLTAGPLIRVQLLRLAQEEHLLLFTLHHIIADGWSMNIFVRELTELYRAYSNNQTPNLAQPAIQYADFARWQAQQSLDPQRQKQGEYWLEQLRGLPAYLDLPTDHPRANSQTFDGAIHTFTIPESLASPLKAFSQGQETTLFMTLVAAFQVMLFRYSGQKDFAIGTPIAGRNHSALEDCIGFFVNTIVLRARLEDNPTFCRFLEQTSGEVMAALSHRDFPFAQLVEELKPDRQLNRSPIFQVLFTLQNTPDVNFHFPGLDGQLTLTHSDTAKYDLSLFVKEVGDELECTWEYNASLFDQKTMQRMTANWQTLLTSILAQPQQSVAALPLISVGTAEQLAQWNNTQIPYPNDATVPALFEAQAAQTPQQVALIFGDEQISYETLNERANQLAHYLRRLGVGPDVLVGLSLERSVEMIVGILAILKAGGAYLPLDAAYPAERQAFMLQNGQASVMLTQQSLRDKLPPHDQLTVFCLDSEWEQVSGESVENLAVGTAASNLAYVMYTSGSTGQPKGVAISHQNIIRLVKGANYANLTANETFLQVAPISFDAATLEIWGSLLNGAKLIIAPPQQLSMGELAALVQAKAVTTLWLTAGLFHLAVDEHLAAFSGVRQLLAGGDVLSPTRVQQALQTLPNCQLINGYGPTENTTFTTCCALLSTEDLTTTVPIGKPISNTQVYILDDNLEQLPIGAIGELYTGGDGLARGYLNEPGLTAAAFIPHPLADTPGQRLYRTGDLARWQPDGRIEFLGRRDNQVKIRGFRIEQGEIETVLNQHPAVRQSVALARTAPTGDKYLVAYVRQKEEEIDTDNLRQYLSQRLPDYMVPTSWVTMDNFPLDPNGKVDRRALPEVDLSQRQLTTELAQPTTPTEIVLTEIWQDVLGIEQISIHDNFFDLGGHSLLASRIMGRVQDRLQQKAPLLTLFKFPTISGLGKALEPEPILAKRPLIDTNLRQELQQIVVRDGQECVALPASFAQQRLFSFDQLEPNSGLYNVPLPIEIQGELDETALQLALADLIARHESLRTTFELIDDSPRQIIHPPSLPDMPFVDCFDYSAEQIEQQIAAESRRPFDLQAGPLLRATLFQHDFDRHTLLLVLHHIITDGWSMPILLHELIALYEEHAEGTLASLPDLPIQYADFALWQRAWLQGERLAEKVQYWREQLAAGPAVLELPTNKRRPSIQTFTGAIIAFQLPPQLTAQLQALGRQLDMTPYMITLTIFYILLHRYTGQSDIVVGSAAANRTLPEQEGLIGFFVNMLALRADLSGNPTTTRLLVRVREMILAAYTEQDMPFERLVDDLAPERTLSHSPLFQVTFTYEKDGNQAIERPLLTWTPQDMVLGLVKYDLLLGLRESGAGIEGVIAYNAELFEPEMMQRMADHYTALLAGAIAQPDKAVASLPLLTDAEWQTQQRWNEAAQYDLPNWANVADQVISIAQQQPQKLALVSETAALTYGQLNQQANQLAHYLIEQGVTAETIVGICLERSPLTAVAALAVWKAGGAYIPLDPDYPADRLAFMLADSQALLLLTTESTGIMTAFSDQRSTLPKTVFLDDWQQLADYPDHNPPSRVEPDNLAYLIYTSGSTGRPKGASIAHRSLVNMVAWHIDTFQLTPAAKSSLVSGPGFDASIWELWPSLAAGATVFIPDDDVRLMPDKMRDWLVSKEISHSFQPTPLVDHMVHLPWPEETALHTMTTGGDVLHHYPPERLPFSLVNNYGPTENTVNASSIVLNPAQKPTALPPIGKPSGNTQVFLLDSHMQPVPVGVTGELCLGGAGLARGYWQRPSLTAARFIPNPFSPTSGERLYRTGDLARYLSDGNIEFMGRVDHQVKIRGFRIELGEIESTLARHPDVREAAVVVHEQDGRKRLVAYPVLTDPQAPLEQLRAYLQTQLPAYMVPTAFVPVAALPVTANGKIDREALPAPTDSLAPRETYAAPETAVEQTLADIWQAVLGLERVGVHDNFFELGGDSIVSIRIVTKAKDAGLSLTVHDLFQHQTIAELSAIVGDGETATVAADEIVTDQPVPLTAIQRWFFEQNFARPDHWNMALLLEMKRPLQKEALEEAISALVAQHDVLRMRFEPTEQGWQQRHASQPNENWLHWFVEPSDPAQLIAEQQRSFSITDGPMFRAAYFDCGRQPHQLLLVVHHLVMDGVSWRILLEDLQTVYEQLESGVPIMLPAKTTSFQRWAQRLDDYVQSDRVTFNKEYWQKALPAPAAIPLDDPNGSNKVATEAIMSYVLTAEETEALLQKVPAAYNTRIDEVLLTAVAQAHQLWTGRSALQINLEGHGREDILPNSDITRTIGWFTSFYPVHLQLSATGQPSDDLKAVKEQLRQVPGRGLEYGLLRYLHPDPDFQEKLAERETAVLSFNYLGQFNEQTEAGLFRIISGANKSSFAPENERPYILDIVSSIHNQQLHVNLHYSSDLHHKETIVQFGRQLMGCLRDLIKHCQSPAAQGYTPSDFNKIVLNQDELDDLLTELDSIL